MRKKMLFAGNNSMFCQKMRDRMQSENIEVHCVKSAADVVDVIQNWEYCMAIIAVQPSRFQDIEAIRTIRNTQKLPIVVTADNLTATDKVLLFQAGANACIEKTIDFAVCTAQAISLIHLYSEAKENEPAYQPKNFGRELMVNTLYRQIIIDGEPLELTRTEYELFICLVAHPCQIWSPMQLYRYVWNDTLGLDGENTVKTHIGNLRKKLAKMGKNYIQNSRGVGYKFVPPL